MAGVFEYLKWRGDITFDMVPCNEVDAMLFSMISYNRFEDIISSDGSDEDLTLQCLGEMYFSTRKKDVPLGALIPSDAMRAFRKMYTLPRYRNVLISNFVNKINTEETYQFGAMTFKIDETTSAVVFRGTDDTVVGWKEDFIIPTVDAIPGEIFAAKYLCKAASETSGRLTVIGHSKGGVEAIYAAASVSPEIQYRIDTVYSFDGPGTSRKFTESEGYRRISDKYLHFIPQTSFVGLLFHNPEQPIITNSVKIGGAAQHDAITWQVLGGRFVNSDKLTSKNVEQMDEINRLISSMSKQEISKFVNIFFNAIEKTGALTLTEFNKRIIANMGTFIGSVNTEEREVKLRINKIINRFISISITAKGKRAD